MGVNRNPDIDANFPHFSYAKIDSLRRMFVLVHRLIYSMAAQDAPKKIINILNCVWYTINSQEKFIPHLPSCGAERDTVFKQQTQYRK